jgi:hypothetical protein
MVATRLGRWPHLGSGRVRGRRSRRWCRITTTTRAPTRNCHPSYPDFCIPPPPPDLDCPDIGETDFTVQGTDPHGFDADNDGIGCES